MLFSTSPFGIPVLASIWIFGNLCHETNVKFQKKPKDGMLHTWSLPLINVFANMSIIYHQDKQPDIPRRYRYSHILQFEWVHRLIEQKGAVAVGGGPVFLEKEKTFDKEGSRASVWMVVNDQWVSPEEGFMDQVNIWQSPDNRISDLGNSLA